MSRFDKVKEKAKQKAKAVQGHLHKGKKKDEAKMGDVTNNPLYKEPKGKENKGWQENPMHKDNAPKKKPR